MKTESLNLDEIIKDLYEIKKARAKKFEEWVAKKPTVPDPKALSFWLQDDPRILRGLPPEFVELVKASQSNNP